MRNKALYLIIYPFVFLLSCSSQQNQDILLKELNNRLMSSTTFAHADAMNTLEAFKTKLADPVSVEKAKIFYPKILRVQKATSDIVMFIDHLKEAVQTQIDLNENEGKRKSVNDLLIENGVYKQLYRQLKQYRKQILLADSMNLNELKNHITIISKEQDTTENENFFKQCLIINAPFGTLGYLNLLQNNLALAELKCIRYYNEQVITHRPWLNSFEAIIGQNAKILRAGDSLEITGGAGVFSKERLLGFSVNGKEVESNNKGLAIYKFKTSKKLGAHTVPVHIRLLNEDSLEHTAIFSVEYTLVEAIKRR